MEFRLPDPGEGLLEADIVNWLVAVGDQVKVNDIIVEVETAKSVVELPSPADGVIEELLVAEGSTVAVGTPILRIREDAAVPAPAQVPAQPQPEAAPAADQAVQREAMLVGYGASAGARTRRARRRPGSAAAEAVPEAPAAPAPAPAPVPAPAPAPAPVVAAAAPVAPAVVAPLPVAAAGPVLAKPPARRIARDLGVDLSTVVGTGAKGVIVESDVLAAAQRVRPATPTGTPHERPAAMAAALPMGVDERVPLRGVRRSMFRSMTASLQVPQASVWVEVDATATLELIAALRNRREFRGLHLSPLLIVAKAACLAISRHPEINSSYDAEAEEIVLHGDVNIGIAAATPRGLVVPNLKAANRLNLIELAEALGSMITQAKEGKVQPSDLALGTFTITNVGVFGVGSGIPIMNEGESAIMCLGTIQRKPWVVPAKGDEPEQLAIRSVVTLSLTIDHRLVDGEVASRFLSEVAAIVADPAMAMLY